MSGNQLRRLLEPCSIRDLCALQAATCDCNTKPPWYLHPMPDGGVRAPAEIHRMHRANEIGFAPTRTGVGVWRCCTARGVHVDDPYHP